MSREPVAGAASAAVRDFLHALRARVAAQPQTTALPEQPAGTLRAVALDEDLPARFAAAAQAAGCKVRRCTEADWPAAVRKILRGHAANKVVIEPQPGTALTAERAAALREALAADNIAAVTERDDETLFAADAAIAGVRAAIAETGTLICTSGAASARGTTLIPPVHIAVVAGEQLVADLFDAFEHIGGWGDLPANVNLITGPSKTADIEGILVTGVHGPGTVHVILL